MEMAIGDLHDCIVNKENINSDDLLRDVVCGLESLHNKKIYHFDLKPKNILKCKSGDAIIWKITDFGTCKNIEDSMTNTTM